MKSLYPVDSGKRSVGSLYHFHSALLSLSPDPYLGDPFLCLSLSQREEMAQTEALEVAWVDVAEGASLNLQHWDTDREVR